MFSSPASPSEEVGACGRQAHMGCDEMEPYAIRAASCSGYRCCRAAEVLGQAWLPLQSCAQSLAALFEYGAEVPSTPQKLDLHRGSGVLAFAHLRRLYLGCDTPDWAAICTGLPAAPAPPDGGETSQGTAATTRACAARVRAPLRRTLLRALLLLQVGPSAHDLNVLLTSFLLATKFPHPAHSSGSCGYAAAVTSPPARAAQVQLPW